MGVAAGPCSASGFLSVSLQSRTALYAGPGCENRPVFPQTAAPWSHPVHTALVYRFRVRR